MNEMNFDNDKCNNLKNFKVGLDELISQQDEIPGMVPNRRPTEEKANS